ncbi:anti-repressor SinI family protein [Bacillus massiliigorillae]|nr:anti-repressor SinI family protein [Bacillus massiliigorillae]
MEVLMNFGEEIDKDWILLMLEAKKIGLTPQEVLDYLTNNSNLISNDKTI